jgi:hypothetical protein
VRQGERKWSKINEKYGICPCIFEAMGFTYEGGQLGFMKQVLQEIIGREYKE